MANQHELLHNFENTKAFKFMQRAIIGFLKDDIANLRKVYTLRYAELYTAEEIKSGIKIGIKAFILCFKLPFSKSAPLAFCAFIIFVVSSTNVGINLRAIVIIIANS